MRCVYAVTNLPYRLWDEKEGFYYDVLRDVSAADISDVTGSRPVSVPMDKVSVRV